jgi:DNA-binding NtrC family response regulator
LKSPSNPVKEKRILLLADPMCEESLVLEKLARMGCQVRNVCKPEQFAAALENWKPDVLLVRLCARSKQWLTKLAEFGPLPPLVALAEGNNIPLYLEAMRAGAFDCVALPIDEQELLRIVSSALNAHKQKAVSFGGVK